MKTKPTQQAIKLLRQEGIFPDFILCRAEQPLDEARKSKIDFNVHISSENIISAPDIETAYEVPVNLQLEGLGQKVLKRLKLQPKKECDLSDWIKLVDNIKNPKNKVKVAVVGKYIKLGDYSVPDSYLSVKEAIVHSGAQLETGVEITWLNADDFVKDPKKLKELSAFDGVIVPGGFGTSGVEGKISAIEYLRTHNIPFLGLCYGMQLAIVEYARHVCGMQGANSTEIDKNTKYPVIDFLPEQKAVVENEQYGGTMRLGVCPAIMKDNSVVLKLYQDVYAGTSRLEADADRFEKLVKEGVCRKLDTKNIVLERHRHRYEVNPEFVDILEKNGLVFSGYYSRQDGTNLMEFIELPDHKFFVATQSHPEFKSRLGNPSPLFYGFLKACLKKDK
jgi:CTP synthase